MYITREADYAVRIVSCLAKSNMRMDAKTISERTMVSLRFSLKILRKLVTGKIVISYKGNRGGYILAAPPEKITIKDVIETVEGQYFFSRCLESSEDCNCPSDECKVQKIYSEISELVRAKMEEVTFDTII